MDRDADSARQLSYGRAYDNMVTTPSLSLSFLRFHGLSSLRTNTLIHPVLPSVSAVIFYLEGSGLLGLIYARLDLNLQCSQGWP